MNLSAITPRLAPFVRFYLASVLVICFLLSAAPSLSAYLPAPLSRASVVALIVDDGQPPSDWDGEGTVGDTQDENCGSHTFFARPSPHMRSGDFYPEPILFSGWGEQSRRLSLAAPPLKPPRA
jgi:hypothetical protein